LLAQRNEPKKGQPYHIGLSTSDSPRFSKITGRCGNSLRSNSPRADSDHFFKAQQSDNGRLKQNLNSYFKTHSFTLSITAVGGIRLKNCLRRSRVFLSPDNSEKRKTARRAVKEGALFLLLLLGMQKKEL
jgi:hypothetical protein